MKIDLKFDILPKNCCFWPKKGVRLVRGYSNRNGDGHFRILRRQKHIKNSEKKPRFQRITS